MKDLIATFTLNSSTSDQLRDIENSLKSVGQISLLVKEDFGWFLSLNINEKLYDLYFGPRDENTEDENIWILWIDKRKSFLKLLTFQKEKVENEILMEIQSSFDKSNSIENFKWHIREIFDSGNEDQGFKL